MHKTHFNVCAYRTE